MAAYDPSLDPPGRAGYHIYMRLSLLIATLAFAGSGLAQEEGTNWTDNYQKALEEAKRTQKPIFLEFRCEA
jgi:hypothetical protein